MKLKRFTLIGIIILILSLVLQAGLLISSSLGASKDSPVLVMYGFDENLFPHTSFGNAVRAAGFDYVVLNKNLSKSLEIEEEVSLPQGYRSREVVYFVQGKDATSAMKIFEDDEDTLGFILLNPVFETNFSMEGMSVSHPAHDVAIFTGNEESVNDSRIMYERLSGEDTLYGVKYETGGAFSSECYSNPSDNRFISIAGINYSSSNAMLSSPVFQIELANYLASNYGDGSRIGSTGIVVWHTLYVFSALLFIASLFAIVSQLQPLRFRDKPDKNNKLRTASLIVIAIVTLILVVGVILALYVPRVEEFRSLIIGLMPVVSILCMALLRFIFVFKHSEVKADDKVSKLFSWFVSAFLVLIPFMLLLNQFGFANFTSEGIKIAIIFAAFVFDFVSILVLAAADNITRLLGEGGCSYYGRLIFVGFTLIPAIAALAIGGFGGIENGTAIGVFGILIAVVPYILSKIIKNRSMSTLQVATVHSLLYLIFLFLMS